MRSSWSACAGLRRQEGKEVGYGEDTLLQGAGQSAREDVILQRSGLLAIFRVSVWMITVWLKVLLGLPQPSLTKIDQCSRCTGSKGQGQGQERTYCVGDMIPATLNAFTFNLNEVDMRLPT